MPTRALRRRRCAASQLFPGALECWRPCGARHGSRWRRQEPARPDRVLASSAGRQLPCHALCDETASKPDRGCCARSCALDVEPEGRMIGTRVRSRDGGAGPDPECRRELRVHSRTAGASRAGADHRFAAEILDWRSCIRVDRGQRARQCCSTATPKRSRNSTSRISGKPSSTVGSSS